MMRYEILELLQQAGVPDEWSWDRIAVVDNSGPIRPSRLVPGDYAWNRGFNLVLYERTGKPCFFCKCRPAHRESFLREMELTRALSADPGLNGAVPATWTARSDTLLLQVSEFLPGPLLAERLPQMSETEWKGAMAQGLALNWRVAAAGEVLLGADPAARINLAEAAEPAIEYLEQVAGVGQSLHPLREVVAQAGEVPSRLQHADLWPGNLLLCRGAWHLLDLEQFGTVRVPFYDVFHFVRTCWDLRRPTAVPARGQPWLRRLGLEPGPGSMTGTMLGEALLTRGLDPAHLPGLLAFYLADTAHRYHRRGVSYSPLLMQNYQRILGEIAALSAVAGDGPAIPSLLSGDPSR